MNTNKIASEYRLSYWANIINERKESGLSVREFCKTAEYHENTYFYWQKKLREAACNELLSQPQCKSIKTAVPYGWAVCEAEPTSPTNNAVCIEIGKSRVTVTTGVDDKLLAAVCRTLVELC